MIIHSDRELLVQVYVAIRCDAITAKAEQADGSYLGVPPTGKHLLRTLRINKGPEQAHQYAGGLNSAITS